MAFAHAKTTAGTVTTSITTPAEEFLGFKRGTNYYWYLTDAVGSIVGVMDNSGSVVNSYSYDPFGTILTSSETSGAEQPFRFAGAYYDAELTLYKMGARSYDPRIGRFLSGTCSPSRVTPLCKNFPSTWAAPARRP
ncbi:MAG: hypothetical protein HY680_05110 [Chloroflexi bacterium]|nr:hypothetical protein [Chloroflexota bacterium]